MARAVEVLSPRGVQFPRVEIQEQKDKVRAWDVNRKREKERNKNIIPILA
jgi:hypothetical protein